MKDQVGEHQNPQNENDLFVLVMNLTGKTICDYQFQEVPKEITFNHYNSHIPESDRQTVTWEKYKFIITYLNWFDNQNHFDKAKMEEFFCKGPLASNMADYIDHQEHLEPGRVIELQDHATPGNTLLLHY